MDLGTVKSKLEAGDYLMPAEYYADVILIFANCREYNQDDDEVTRLGNETEVGLPPYLLPLRFARSCPCLLSLPRCLVMVIVLGVWGGATVGD